MPVTPEHPISPENATEPDGVVPAGSEVSQPLVGKRVGFVGKLGGVTRREAQQLVKAQGGLPVESTEADCDLLVIGADVLPLSEEELLSPEICEAAAAGELEILSETQLWQRLGMVESEQHIRCLYTPAMLAHLLGVPVAVIRRWHRRGLIVPVREVYRLPYFNFQEVATARRLAQLLAAGASPQAVEKKLARLARYLPDVERPLAQLSVIVQGKQLLLRQGEGLIEPGGQLRIDFEAFESEDRAGDPAASSSSPILSLQQQEAQPGVETTPGEMIDQAVRWEDEGRLEEAVGMYRSALALGGPSAEVCFLLAELLYRLGDVTAARERYFMSIELDEEYVEARASLGCVLAELGQHELAVAALEGALELHDDYPDAHYHLARSLDELECFAEAIPHWRRFLALAPNSPWADEAQQRLEGQICP